MGKISKTIVSLSPLSFIWLFISDTDYDKGMKAMEAGEYDRAIDFFYKVVKPYDDVIEIKDRYVIASYVELGKIYLYVDSSKLSNDVICKYLQRAKGSNLDLFLRNQANILLEAAKKKATAKGEIKLPQSENASASS